MKLLLVLDDDRSRLGAFEQIAARLGKDWAVKSWRDAPTMISEIEQHIQGAHLISLDNDLYKDLDSDPDPGSGRLVAEHLSTLKPTCPVIVHSTNTDAAWGIHNALRAVGWTVELVHHLNQPKWIEELWLPKAARLVAPAPEPRAPDGAALSLSGYRALCRTLPVPTAQQVREFAQYVAGAHSWYKHLRLLPANTPFQIFLDPGAGMQLVRAADGRVTGVLREEQGFHYSWLPTAEYRQRFCHLAFSRSAGTRVSELRADGDQLIPSDDAPRIYDPASRAFYALPAEALTAGRVFVSAIVHEAASSKYLWENAIARTGRFDEVFDRLDGLEIGQRILDRCKVLKEDPSRDEPAPGKKGDLAYEFSLAALDFPLHQLVVAERKRQLEGIEAAAARALRLVARA